MSAAEADRFISRLGSDPEFAATLEGLKDDPDALYAVVVAEGFDATPEEIRSAFLEEMSQYLDEEQLAAVAGGLSTVEIGAIAGGAVGAAAITTGVVVGVVVSSAAGAAI
jgi:predicted ribosomally synthesized peptide with nif11-like leader